MIDGRQVRAARAMLGWSRTDLLKAADLSMSALLRLESELSDTRVSTLRKIVMALSAEGIEFINREDGSIGVVMKGKQARQTGQTREGEPLLKN
ncbi:MAG: XRE family transcriptional regulator [Thauera sp.]|jgi:transcriptional regulator with XRE-family HTH domain|nr:XRE family transcriptional regulator [Thauera sp.]